VVCTGGCQLFFRGDASVQVMEAWIEPVFFSVLSSLENEVVRVSGYDPDNRRLSLLECCLSSGRGLCDGPITRPEESYRLRCV
jgi:hypothetical protein